MQSTQTPIKSFMYAMSVCIIERFLSVLTAVIVTLKENIDTSTPTGKFMLTVFSAMYELERDNIRDRQREGIAIRKAKGLYKGKPQMQIDKNEFQKITERWRAGEITAVSAMKKLNLKPNTFYRRVKEWGL